MRMPSLRVGMILAVAGVTFREVIRDRILYGAFFLSLLFVFLGALVSTFTFVDSSRVLMNFGLTTISFSLAMMAILLGARGLSVEFEKKTISLVFSKPIQRSEFLVGKALGLFSVVSLAEILVSTVYLLILKNSGGDLSLNLFYALFFILLMSLILLSLSLFFSLFTTVSLSVVFSFSVWIVGHNLSQLRFLLKKMDSGWMTESIHYLLYLLPDFERFHLGKEVTYQIPLSASYLTGNFFYGLIWTLLVLGFSSLLLSKKEIS